MPVTNQPSAGGVWKRLDRNGREYFYFQVEVKGFKYTFRAFLNTKKTGEKQPDYRLFAVDEGVPVQKWEPKPRPEVKPEDRKVAAPPAYEEAPEENWKDGSRQESDEEEQSDGLPPAEETDDDDGVPF